MTIEVPNLDKHLQTEVPQAESPTGLRQSNRTKRPPQRLDLIVTATMQL